MIRALSRLWRELFHSQIDRKLVKAVQPAQPATGGRGSMRRVVILSVVLVVLLGAGALGWFGYNEFLRSTPPPPTPDFTPDPSASPVKEDEFEKLAKEDPIALLGQ